MQTITVEGLRRRAEDLLHTGFGKPGTECTTHIYKIAAYCAVIFTCGLVVGHIL